MSVLYTAICTLLPYNVHKGAKLTMKIDFIVMLHPIPRICKFLGFDWVMLNTLGSSQHFGYCLTKGNVGMALLPKLQYKDSLDVQHFQQWQGNYRFLNPESIEIVLPSSTPHPSSFHAVLSTRDKYIQAWQNKPSVLNNLALL